MADRLTLLCNIDDPQASGLLASRAGSTPAATPYTFRDATIEGVFFPVRPTEDGDGFEQVDLSTLSAFRIGVGQEDERPTSETFSLTVNSTTDDLTSLAYNISAATLQTALNANSGVQGSGTTVTVTGEDGFFYIKCNTANIALTITGNGANLIPSSTVEVNNPVVAAAGVQAVYTIELLQRPFAYTTTYTVQNPTSTLGTISSVDTGANTVTCTSAFVAGNRYRLEGDDLPAGLSEGIDYYALTSATASALALHPDGTAIDITDAGTGTRTVKNHEYGVTVEILNSGSESTPARYQVTIDPTPLSGSFTFLWAQQQQTKIVCTANTAVAAIWRLSLSAGDSAGSMDGLYIDLGDDSDNTARAWFSNGGAGPAPATPPGGRLIEIEYVANDSAAVLLNKLADELNTDGDFVCVYEGDDVLKITAAVAGEKQAPSNGTVTTASFTTVQEGLVGRLCGHGFVLNDRFGTVGVYITGGTYTTVPEIASEQTRTLAINLAGGETASAAATAIATGVDGDAEFSASAASSTVTATNTYAGTPPTDSIETDAGYFGVTITVPGFSISGTIDAGYSEGEFTNAITPTDGESPFIVTKTGGCSWQLVRSVTGATTAPTVDDYGLEFPIGIEFSLGFNTLAVYQALQGTEDDELRSTLEVKATFSGQDEEMWLNANAITARDLLRTSTTGGPTYSPDLSVKSLSVTGTAGAGFIDLANQSAEPAAPAAGVRVYGTNSGLNIVNAAGFHALIDLDNLTADTEFAFPESGGTLVVETAAQILQNKELGSGMSQTHSAITYGATTNLDLSGNSLQSVSLTGNITFTTSNRAAGRSKTVRIIGDGSSRNLTFPAWKFVGASAPTSLAASKVAILTITAFGTADTDIVAAYAVEP